MMSWASIASSNHAALAAKEWNGRCEAPVALSVLTAVLDLGVLAVAQLERDDVLIVLVGDEVLEAVAACVGEGQLRAGVRALSAADQPRALPASSRG
jgi:hypothetical protein